MQCLFRICCEADEEPADYYPPVLSQQQPAVAARMPRGDRGASYHTTSTVEGDDDVHGAASASALHPHDNTLDDSGTGGLDTTQDSETDCCRPHAKQNPHAISIHDFFRRLQTRWHRYDSLERVPSNDNEVEEDQTDQPDPFRKRSSSVCSSPLRTAASFNSSRAIPTICQDEIVLPGSALQHAMAESMSATLERQDDECVICMEGFDPTNPRMPTLCGCGENKTYFHLPCLYQWIEQSKECPSCRERLRWEEF